MARGAKHRCLTIDEQIERLRALSREIQADAPVDRQAIPLRPYDGPIDPWAARADLD
jgi:hypothetical protein